MKMICPHCGVKGSAADSLLGKRVKCPKCTEIFVISSEVVQPILLEDAELQQVDDPVDTRMDIPSEEEVDDVFSKLLGDGATSSEAVEQETEVADLVAAQLDEQEDEVIAALSDIEQEPASYNEWLGEEETGDETLTVIEDFPEETHALEEQIILEDSNDIDRAGEESILDAQVDDTTIAEGTGEQWEQKRAEMPDEDHTEVLAFEDELENISAKNLPDSDEETVTEENLWGGEEAEDDDRDQAELEDMDGVEKSRVDDDEAEEIDEGVVVQKCSACGEYVDHDAKHEYGSHVYCEKCVPTELKKGNDGMQYQAVSAGTGAGLGVLSGAAVTKEEGRNAPSEAVLGRFTIATLIKDAYHYSKGAKGSIWAGVIVMYLVLIGLGIGSVFLLPQWMEQTDSVQAILFEGGLQAVFSFLSFVFTAGILMIAVQKIGQKPFSWRTVFSGFSRVGSLLLLFILQSIMLVIGFLLFVLPGIYLSVGYILAIPLLFVRGLSPWQALEESRKAVHKRWWTVFFAMITMSILMGLSAIPLGLGLIWTVPMFVVLVGVLYYHFFGAEE